MVPIYLVSPQLFVTREHIISESASTSSSLLPDFGGSGEGSPLPGVETAASRGVPLVMDEASCMPGVLLLSSDELFSLTAAVLSASLFSRVPRSVAPESSSDSRPDSLKRDSMRPNRFSRPSMYLALLTLGVDVMCWKCVVATHPFGGLRFFSTWVKTHSVL